MAGFVDSSKTIEKGLKSRSEKFHAKKYIRKVV